MTVSYECTSYVDKQSQFLNKITDLQLGKNYSTDPWLAPADTPKLAPRNSPLPLKNSNNCHLLSFHHKRSLSSKAGDYKVIT